MSWQQCLTESLEETEQKGYEAFRRGELVKLTPKIEDYHGKKDPLAFQSANRYHERWVMGWEKAQVQESQNG